MPDVNTREAILPIMKDNCVLKTVLKGGKPCPYIDEKTNACDTCSFDWLSLADEILKVGKVRRASYEKEMERRKALEVELEETKDRLQAIYGLFVTVGQGIAAVKGLLEFGEMCSEKNHEKTTEEGDEGFERSSDSAES